MKEPKDKPLKNFVRKLRKDWLHRLLKYEQYQTLLGDRNSFSKAVVGEFPQTVIADAGYGSKENYTYPLKERWTKASRVREVVVSLERLRHQKQAREFLWSEEGYTLAVRKMTEPERVFGQLKNNRGFQRFLLRCMEKVTLEVGWHSLTHNVLKQASVDQ